MQKNLAGKKKVATAIDFAKVFADLSLDEKMKVSANLNKTIDTGISHVNGKSLSEIEMTVCKGISMWCMMNILIGSELCPASTIDNHVKTAHENYKRTTRQN